MCVTDARERAYDAIRQALARRLASPNAGRSPLGAPPWRFFTRGRASVSGIASGSVQRAPRSQVVVPGGRGPGPPGASSCEPPPQDATPRSAFRIVSRRRPSMSAADGPYTLASLRSQYINSIRSRKCSQPFAAAVEKWIVADHRRAVRGWAKVANTRSTSRSVLAAKAWSCGPRVWQPPADRSNRPGPMDDPPAALSADKRIFALFPRPPRLLRGNGREVLMVIPGSPSTLLWL